MERRDMKTRKVYPGQVHHVCQQTVGGVVVFYTLSDYLVYFTIFCTVARRYGLKVLALCPMVDHTHSVVVVPEQFSYPLICFQKNGIDPGAGKDLCSGIVI